MVFQESQEGKPLWYCTRGGLGTLWYCNRCTGGSLCGIVIELMGGLHGILRELRGKVSQVGISGTHCLLNALQWTLVQCMLG